MLHKSSQFLISFFILLTIIPAQAEILSLSHKNGKLQDSVCIQLSVNSSEVDPVYGAVFLLDYDPSVVLSHIKSDYFDTFDAQLSKAYGSAYTDNLSSYGQSFVYETDLNEGITYVVAARCTATKVTNVLFDFCFYLKDGASADSYPIYLKPIPKTFADRTIDENSEPHPILTGLDSSYPYTSNSAYPVLLDGNTDSSGNALQTIHGMITFSIEDETDPLPKIDTVVGQITSSVLGKTEGISGANVTLIETGQTVKSDSNGFYTFTNVPEGNYTIEAGTSFLNNTKFQAILTQVNAVIPSFQLNQWNMDGFFSFSDVQSAVSDAVGEYVDIIANMFTKNELDEAVDEAVSEKEEIISRMHLDVDCNGEADALTDGLMIMRYLFGITKGESLLENAVDNVNGTCTSEEEIIANIQRILPSLNTKKKKK